MQTTAPHIHLDDRGVAWIDDTNIKVIEIALEKIAHDSNADEIYKEHEGYLSLAQIHAAFAWYYDHQSEMDELIREQRDRAEKLCAETLISPGRQRLRDLGKLP